MPLPVTTQQWAERTPANFVFNVKAFRLFTGHQAQPRVFPKDIQEALGLPLTQKIYYRDLPEEIQKELWGRFFQALEPLHAAGKLGAVHFQFAPWLTYSRASREHVAECAERASGHTMSVEFRHQTWFNDVHREYTLRFEREYGLVHTVVDAPQGFVNSVAAHWDVTHPDVALVRLHGRNAATWNARTTVASDRFNYDYSDIELAALAESINALAARVPRVQVIFNNNYEDQGQRNASTLVRLLRSA